MQRHKAGKVQRERGSQSHQGCSLTSEDLASGAGKADLIWVENGISMELAEEGPIYNCERVAWCRDLSIQDPDAGGQQVQDQTGYIPRY